jgi:hypothetical protein
MERMRPLTRRELLDRAAAVGALLTLPSLLAACDLEGGGSAGRVSEARVPGRLPPDGRPTFAGFTLPKGRGWRPGRPFDVWVPAGRDNAAFWCTEDGVENAFALAGQLAAAHRRTGIWPVLWLFAGDRPGGYLDRPAAMGRVDASTAEAILAEQWKRHPPKRSWVFPLSTDFPGLAEPTGKPRPYFDPFGLLRERQRADSSWNPAALTPSLMLVPCRRPADAVARIGLLCGTAYAGVEDPALVSSVLRSWEDRFHAVLVALAPGEVALAVGAPPATFEEALHIAAEQFAFAPGEEAGAPGALAHQARTLLRNNPYDPSTRDVWFLGWND